MARASCCVCSPKASGIVLVFGVCLFRCFSYRSFSFSFRISFCCSPYCYVSASFFSICDRYVSYVVTAKCGDVLSFFVCSGRERVLEISFLFFGIYCSVGVLFSASSIRSLFLPV